MAAAGGQAGASGGAGQGGGAGSGCPAQLPGATVVENDGATARLLVKGDPAGSEIGTFDPSLVEASDGAVVMSYTSVNLQRHRLHTRVARSTDGGKTFSFIAAANKAEEGVSFALTEDDKDCPGKSCKNATIIHEVSSLLEDPGAEPGSRWLLFTHSYAVLEPDPKSPNDPRLRYAYGNLRLGKAPAPEGPWSPPEPMLGWPSAVEFSSQAPQLTTAIAGLSDCLALTEPAAEIDPATGAIDLAVGCVHPGKSGGFPIRIELLRSTDHAASWQRQHTLLEASDAPCVGGKNAALNAAHLFHRDGKSYLIATPDGPVSLPGGATIDGYRGCLLFARTPGGIERDATGAPVVLGRIDAAPKAFAGACSHHPAGGFVLSALSFAAPPDIFRMFGPVGTGP